MAGKTLVYMALIPMAAAALATPSAGTELAQEKNSLRVYVGAAPETGGGGIYLLDLEVASGQLNLRGRACETEKPFFLALHPGKPVLYAANIIKEGTVSAFSVDENSGMLAFLNRLSSEGAGPCHLSVSPSGGYVAVANFNSGSVTVLSTLEDGRLGALSAFVQHQGRDGKPEGRGARHAHGAYFDVAGRFIYVPDLGLDRVLAYRFDEPEKGLVLDEGASTPLPRGAGPRHIAFHPNNRFAYVLNQLNNTVSVFAYESATGQLSPIQTVRTLPDSYSGANDAAEIQVHPSGRFLYASNRGHDSIASYSIDSTTGLLTATGFTPSGGKTPMSFSLDPSGTFMLVANQDSDSVVLFRVDRERGVPVPANSSVSIARPISMVFVNP